FFVGSYFSFNLNILDYLWHGFHFPNQLPARQSFLFIFVLLTFGITRAEKPIGVISTPPHFAA
ncbi:MAG: YfhO family protein, partial [Clostridiales bacterium]|nr:YfhO family protein [Clostridiales bacterium]